MKRTHKVKNRIKWIAQKGGKDESGNVVDMGRREKIARDDEKRKRCE